MSSVPQSFSSWMTKNPRLPAIGTAVLVLGAALWIGALSRSKAQQLATKRSEWERSSNQLATVRQQFKTPSSSESAALLSESARMSALGVPATERVSLIELVARLAEASSLTEVRVNFRTGVDSVFVPPRSIGPDAINAAGYSVSVDFSGSFASVVQFVSSLPPSVSISSLGAARNGGHPTYHVLLAVYELPNADHAG